MDVFGWRQGKMAHLLALTSSEPLWVKDVKHDSHYQICNVYEIGELMSHAGQPRWSDIYDYEDGRYVWADPKFPAEFAHWPKELKEVLGRYPGDTEIRLYLNLAKAISALSRSPDVGGSQDNRAALSPQRWGTGRREDVSKRLTGRRSVSGTGGCVRQAIRQKKPSCALNYSRSASAFPGLFLECTGYVPR